MIWKSKKLKKAENEIDILKESLLKIKMNMASYLAKLNTVSYKYDIIKEKLHGINNHLTIIKFFLDSSNKDQKDLDMARDAMNSIMKILRE